MSRVVRLNMSIVSGHGRAILGRWKTNRVIILLSQSVCGPNLNVPNDLECCIHILKICEPVICEYIDE